MKRVGEERIMRRTLKVIATITIVAAIAKEMKVFIFDAGGSADAYGLMRLGIEPS